MDPLSPPAAAPNDRLDDGFRRLHPAAPRIWRLGSVATAVVVAGITLAIAFGVAGANAVSISLAVVMAVVVVVSWLHPALAYRHWSYRIGDESLELRHGVWFRTSASVPFHRIQQIDIDQGPIQRRVGVVTLKLRTAAAMTDGTVPHLASEEADVLRARLLASARAAQARDDGH